VGGDVVYCSAAYGVGAAACKVAKDGASWTAVKLWEEPGKLQNHWTTPVYHDGYLYSLVKDRKTLSCIDVATGNEVWAQPGFTWQGATTFVDGCVLVQDDGGALVLVEATPKAYKEVARCKPLSGQCWTMATIAHGHIFCRSANEGGQNHAGTTGAIVCLDVSAK
jgi:outer membrane protein assembly factor BamB